MNNVVMQSASVVLSLKENVVRKLDEKIVQYDAWFLVFVAVLLSLAFAIGTALAIWCLLYQGKKFTGNWGWAETGFSINVECN
ncbi:hypothetical protein DOK67_0001863 [Enterococcus sp. DIV0212c]|uniref:hypothetical protein n=1 Tax=Enterococcus sp. DIV0212c TaxID=2230867 RepID=UPI001A9B361D|nr:hypothetical protein [Enterococcus sp. DIV0212c]MBO1352448.1 hypothetical protein [Enterococcus sp. DIV0212c]